MNTTKRVLLSIAAAITLGSASSFAADSPEVLDLNRASFEELLAFEGIGRAYAARIVAGRPYRTEFDLVGRRVIPVAAFHHILGRIAVGY